MLLSLMLIVWLVLVFTGLLCMRPNTFQSNTLWKLEYVWSSSLTLLHVAKCCRNSNFVYTCLQSTWILNKIRILHVNCSLFTYFIRLIVIRICFLHGSIVLIGHVNVSRTNSIAVLLLAPAFSLLANPPVYYFNCFVTQMSQIRNLNIKVIAVLQQLLKRIIIFFIIW